MAWKANIASIVADKTNGNLLATINYSDNTGQTFSQVLLGNDLTDASIADHAQRVCVAFETRDAALSALMLRSGPVILPRDGGPQPDQITQATVVVQLAQGDLIQKAQALAMVKTLADGGAMVSSDPSYISAQSDAVTSVTTLKTAKNALAKLAKPV